MFDDSVCFLIQLLDLLNTFLYVKYGMQIKWTVGKVKFFFFLKKKEQQLKGNFS